MKLVRTTIFSGIITFIRIASGFVAGKAVAIFTGPAGVALIGAFTNFIAIVLTFANGAINTGVIKYTAEFNGDELKLKKLFSTSLKISVYCSFIVGAFLVIFSSYLSEWILSDVSYANAVRILGITIVFYSLNSLLISILNGKGQIRTYTIVNTLGSIIGLIFTVTLVFFYKIQGALYALVLAQSIVFFVTLFMVIKSPWFSKQFFLHAFDRTLALKLGQYSIMAIVTALTVPVSQIVLRNLVITKLGMDAAGQWQGLMRISDGYLLIITTALSTYYLPKLSSLTNREDLKKEIFKGYKVFLPAVFLGCVIIYFLRFFIIKILYTQDFIAMESLFIWQLLGDFFKIAAWILAYLMLAKAMIKVYIITEVIFSISFVLLGYCCIELLGLRGITLAFFLNYLAYFLYMIIYFRKLLLSKAKV